MSDAHTPITTEQVLQLPKGHVLYTTTREVPMEFPLPTLGAALSALTAAYEKRQAER